MSALILASASPRRAELLTSAGYTFAIAPAEVDETPYEDEPPLGYVLRIARTKATVVAARMSPSAVVLAADTTVVAGGRILGKPEDDQDAAEMLEALAGRTHEVHTAVVVRAGGRELWDVITTRVSVLPLDARDIAWYIASGEPAGKAGAYGIQGRAARFIDRIEGSWSNVVGLPIATVHRLLSEAGH